MCQYAEKYHEVNSLSVYPRFVKLKCHESWLNFWAESVRDSKVPSKTKVRSTFCWLSPKRWALQLEQKREVGMTFLEMNSSVFLGGDTLLVTNWSPKCCFLAICLDLIYRMYGGWLDVLVLNMRLDYEKRVEMDMNHQSCCHMKFANNSTIVLCVCVLWNCIFKKKFE